MNRAKRHREVEINIIIETFDQKDLGSLQEVMKCLQMLVTAEIPAAF